MFESPGSDDESSRSEIPKLESERRRRRRSRVGFGRRERGMEGAKVSTLLSLSSAK